MDYLPSVRRDNFVIQELPEELLVYDLDKNKGHCLNRTAAFVWKHCDGQTSVSEIARHLRRESKSEVDEKVIWLALSQLSKKHLLETPVITPTRMAGINRRQMIRALGVGAVVAVPLITSVFAPTAVEAATCGGNGASCAPGNPPCCAGLVCCAGVPPTCCAAG
jgi:hypothetical protein